LVWVYASSVEDCDINSSMHVQIRPNTGSEFVCINVGWHEYMRRKVRRWQKGVKES